MHSVKVKKYLFQIMKIIEIIATSQSKQNYLHYKQDKGVVYFQQSYQKHWLIKDSVALIQAISKSWSENRSTEARARSLMA